jgi:vacuolar-type H+-ATPase subunit I/STV1
LGIARIKKIQIVAHQSIKEEITELLQRLALVHIINIKELLAEKDLQAYSEIFAQKDKDLEKSFQEVAYALELIRSYESKT